MCWLGEFMMRKTAIVGTSDQLHARLKGSETASRMTRCARQRGQSFPKCAIQAFNESRVEHTSSLGACEQLLSLLQAPMRHLTRNLRHTLCDGVLDHRSHVQLRPDPQTGPSTSQRLLDLFAERSLDTVGVGCPAIGQNQQGAQGLRTSAHLHYQAGSLPTIAPQTHSSCQPKTCRDHHGQSHPGHHVLPFHTTLSGLNMHQVERCLLDDRLMHLVTMNARSISPSGYCALIQPKGMHKSLDRASRRQERH